MAAVAQQAAAVPKPRWTRRRLGYLLWLVALAFFFVPEILAASKSEDSRLPFTTLSGLVGHLEYRYPAFEVVTTAVIVFTLLSIRRVPPRKTSGRRQQPRKDKLPHRTAGGRITFKTSAAVAADPDDYDAKQAPAWLVLAAFLAALLIAFGTIAARLWWPDPPPGPGQTNALFHPGYVLYGSIALLWFVVPSIYAFVAGKDAPFPTLFRTLLNLENWLRGHGEVGKAFAWLLSFVLVWGFVFLLFHLVFYPFPDITKILNPTGQ
jgi:hypothetical protein